MFTGASITGIKLFVYYSFHSFLDVEVVNYNTKLYKIDFETNSLQLKLIDLTSECRIFYICIAAGSWLVHAKHQKREQLSPLNGH